MPSRGLFACSILIQDNRQLYAAYRTNVRILSVILGLILLVGKNKTSILLTSMCCLVVPVSVNACPDLSSYYPDTDEEWGSVEQALAPLLSLCSDSSEYFALLGTAQLRGSDLMRALESLELALLLDPENGAALIDYAEVLFRQGQVLAALEINQQLLSRDDLPGGLEGPLRDRQRRWRRLTNQTSFEASILGGYDDNLNSAPMARELALTLSGESVLLQVSPEFRPASGAYLNFALGGANSAVWSETATRFSGQVRGRFSENSKHDLVQASTRFVLAERADETRWDVGLGFDHLVYGANSLFSSADLRASYLMAGGEVCRVYPRVAVQYQVYHSQSWLSGLESKLGLGLECDVSAQGSMDRIAVEASGLHNKELKSGRLGGDRQGWQFNVAWQRQLGLGLALLQYTFTRMEDEEGYSPLFSEGVVRDEHRDSLYFQYRRPAPILGSNAQILANIYYHSQRNTIDLFQTRGTSAEIGISWGF